MSGTVNDSLKKYMFRSPAGVLSKAGSQEKRSPGKLAIEFVLVAMFLVAG